MFKRGKSEGYVHQIGNPIIQAGKSSRALPHKATMGSRHTTIIVEPRLLFRAGLKSRMADDAYHIVSDFASSAEIGASAILIEPQLVILGALSAKTAVMEAAEIRKVMPTSKIVLLYEFVSFPDFEKVRQSPIDGCLPSSVSFETLINALDFIMAGNGRTMVFPDAKRGHPH
jgi:two-component system nitrate/nitrite response regulator NarL